MEVTTLVELKALTKLQTVAELPFMELPLCSKPGRGVSEKVSAVGFCLGCGLIGDVVLEGVWQ